MNVVIVGLGYVGLPLAVEASAAGFRVHGIDRRPDVVDGLTDGRSHVDDVDDERLGAALARGMTVGHDFAPVSAAEVVVMCVPTPLKDGTPDLSAIRSATSSVGEQVRAGSLVVLESTTYPGTTEEIVVPTLAEVSGLDVPGQVCVGYSPERVDPGNGRWGLRNTPKVVGGLDEESLRRATTFYEKLCDQVVPASSVRAAEMSKLLENTYRHVNIALVNELALVADDLGVDIFEVIELAASKPFGYQPFFPGPGVGGHCIPIDPHYLSYRLRSLGRGFRFVELAREINESMPGFVALRATEVLNKSGKAVRGSSIVLAGVAYKPGVSDVREAPSVAVVRRLRSMGADVTFVDPHVPRFAVDGVEVERADDLVEAAATSDLLLIVTPHPSLPLEEASRTASAVLDTRGSVGLAPNVERL